MIKTLACLGDSNTFGFDPASLWGGRYPRDVRWTGRLAERGFAVHNFGQNGLGVSRDAVHPILVQEVKAVQPDLITVMLGSNDLLAGLSPAGTAAHMKKLLSLILSEKAAPRVLLIAPVPFRRGSWTGEEGLIDASQQLAALYRPLAASPAVSFADAGAWDIPLAFDGVHFTEDGHRLFAERLAALLS